jgi:hypothetical protein
LSVRNYFGGGVKETGFHIYDVERQSQRLTIRQFPKR